MKKIFAALMITLAMVCACKPSTPEVTPDEPVVEVTDSASVEVTDSTFVETPENPDFNASTEDMIPEEGNM
ncbi:MAG: hypothetical protein IKT74_03665 [Bacteroidales bacterium]|nr:hypothetical protein [Bacteroidales bacterium]